MASDVQIVNIALGRIGEGPIASLDDNSKAARAAKLVFADERDFVLRDYPWAFAMRYVTLGHVGGDDETAVNYDWQYSYRYPASALTVRRIVREGARTVDREPAPFELGSDDTGRLIFTDEPPDVTVQITARVTASERFDPVFVSMLAWRLGAALATPLSRNDKSAQDCYEMYLLEKNRAQLASGNERQSDAARQAEWIDNR